MAIRDENAMAGGVSMGETIPLFPLRTVLFTGGVMPLKIFEPRYVDMVSRCMREDMGFGVVLIREGVEARRSADDAQPEIFDVGTYARIVDFDQLPDGLLGITGAGERKFRVIRTYEQEDHLLMGAVEFLRDEPEMALPEEFEGLGDLLRKLLEHPMVKRLKLTVDLGEARSVSWRLAELLPLEPEIKQSLLQLRHPRERLMELKRLIDNLQSSDDTVRRSGFSRDS